MISCAPGIVAFKAGVLVEVIPEVKPAIRIGRVLEIDELHGAIVAQWPPRRRVGILRAMTRTLITGAIV